jgi:hypothetical protein
MTAPAAPTAVPSAGLAAPEGSVPLPPLNGVRSVWRSIPLRYDETDEGDDGARPGEAPLPGSGGAADRHQGHRQQQKGRPGDSGDRFR